MHRTRIVSPIVASSALVLLGAGPASAADTDATFTITGGALPVTTRPRRSRWARRRRVRGTQRTWARRWGTVTVTDGRGGGAGWVASVLHHLTPPAPAAVKVPP